VSGAPAAPEYEFRRAGGLEVLVWPALEAAGVDAVVTTRAGGVSGGPYATLNLGLHVGDDPAAVLENRGRAAAAVGAGGGGPATLGDVVFAEQVHGRSTAVVTAADRGRGTRSTADAVAGTDVLVTRAPGVVLACLVADCVPIVLVDPEAGVLATVHAGWRGTVARAADAALGAMAGLGARVGRVVAGIGPAIDPARYRVGDEVAEAVRGAFGDPGGLLTHDPGEPGDGEWLLDLWAANRRVLVEAGVPGAAIHTAAVPTGAADGGEGPFFSDRAVRPCGRFGLLARLRTRGGGAGPGPWAT
jgi:hypothetical protein